MDHPLFGLHGTKIMAISLPKKVELLVTQEWFKMHLQPHHQLALSSYKIESAL
jgi:hypothetical protein